MIDEALLLRYIARETSEAENQTIDIWRKALPANEQMLQDIIKIWDKTATLKPTLPTFDTEKAWAKLSAVIDFEQTPKLNISRTLPTATGAGRQGFFTPLRIVAVFVIAVAIVGLYWVVGRQGAGEVVAQITKTHKDTPQLTLADNSTLKLSQNAQITYPKTFAKDHRTVQFQGKAQFSITPDAKRPFIIQTRQKATIKVLGTSFWVNAQPDTDQIDVNVIEGKVEFAVKDKKITLQAGEAGTWTDKTQILAKIQTRLKTYSFDFQNTPLPTAIAHINQACNTQIELAPELLKCSITVNYENQNLETILQILTETLDLTQTAGRQGAILLKGKGCE